MNREAPSTRELHDFGLISGGLFALLFGLFFPWLRSHYFPLWPWILCAALAGSALLRPQLLKYVFAGWNRLGLVLGWINSRIVLTVTFYLIIVPIGLLVRLIGRDPMARAFDPGLASYRVPSFKAPVENMERLF
jgi:hypothetical protein